MDRQLCLSELAAVISDQRLPHPVRVAIACMRGKSYMSVLSQRLRVSTKATQHCAEPGTGRAKVSPKPWNWEQSHEIGCGYPVGAHQEVQVPPDQSLASRSGVKSTCTPSHGSTKLDGTRV
jgi:hypothetical protein